MYAELIWGGTYINGSINLSANINDPVSFQTPSGTFSITPDTATYNQFELGSGASGYVRSANVTSLVQQGGAGTYSTGSVVGTIVVTGDPTANNAGWTLGVIYRNPTLPFRNMSLRAGAVLVQAASGPVNTTLTGFSTPVSGALGGRILLSAQEGDANRTGDQALFGPTSSSLAALSGPNNFANNFFASQINGNTGNLDTSGTFGTRNQTNGAPGSNIIGGRQGWDITNVDVSARLTNNQTSAVLSLTTSGDAYAVNANAIQVDINSPTVNVTKSANVSGTVQGDTIIYTVAISNTGTASATDVVLTDALPQGTTFVAGSVTVNGTARPTNNIVTGVPLGTLAFGTTITVVYRVVVTSVPSPQVLVNTANAAFTFQSVAGGSVVSGVIPSNSVSTPVYSPQIGMVKSANTANATVGNPVTYTVVLRNTGNIAATTTFTDTIPSGTSFIPGTFTVGGSPVPGANPATGVAIGSIPAGGSVTVAFQLLVNTLPNPPTLSNQAFSSYTFQPPDGRTIAGNASSNTVVIPVAVPDVTVAKSASPADAVVQEVVTYTSVIANNSSAAITNVIFSDPLPAGTSLVAGSVTVGGSPLPQANPASGFSLGTLAPGTSTTVFFQVLINSLPNPPRLNNQSSVSYSSGTFTGISVSNTTVTPVYQAVITASKSANRTTVTVGDTVTYSFALGNSGNIAVNATLTDTIPTGESFVAGSVFVGGVNQPGSSPVNGIPVGPLAAGGSTTVTFQSTVNSLPPTQQVTDRGTVSYTYQLPSGRALSGSALSNSLTLPVSLPNITIAKSANRTVVTPGDLLTYSLTVSNSSSLALTNVVVTDTIPPAATFVAGTIVIAGTPQASGNPAAGIAIGSLPAASSVVISFQVRVQSLPPSGVLANNANVSYTAGSFNGNSVSNTLSTPVNQPIIQIVKSASSTTVAVGNTFTYFFELSNSGNYPANIVLTDTIAPGSSFVANSVIVGGTPTPNVDPTTGIPLGNLQPGSTITVSFVALANSLPPSQQYANLATAAYAYNLADGRQIAVSVTSNALVVNVSAPQITVTKMASPASAVTGDTVSFTSTVTNVGLAAANNVVVSDPIPLGSAFVPGSVLVNGVPQPSAFPPTGIPIGTLAPGASATVTFEVTITMPPLPIINNQSITSFTSGVFSGTSSSNVTQTPITQPVISVIKAANTVNAVVGDTITYTLTISNSGNLAANAFLSDNVPAGTSFVPNSVIVGGISVPGADPAVGFSVGSIADGASVVVTFSVVVNTLPNPQNLTNQATSTYTFSPPDGRLLSGTSLSNVVVVPVSAPDVDLIKSTPSTVATVGDTVTYTTQVTNSGIGAVTGVAFSDPIPQGSSFVPGSVTVNGVAVPAANPSVGFSLGTIASGVTVPVTFSVLVNAIPTSGQLSNQALASFTSGTFSGTSFSNIVATPVLQPILTAVKAANTQNATVGDTVNYSVVVTNSGNYPAFATFSDTVPTGATFVPNSVIINGSPFAGADPSTPFAIGIIQPGASKTVAFSFLMSTLPPGQNLVNQATVGYAYNLPDGRTITNTILSNTYSILVSSPDVSVVKSTPTTAVAVGDTLVYTVVVTNNGIGTVSSIVFTDPVPPGSAFVPGSVLVNGVVQPSAVPATGVPLGTLGPGASATVQFNVVVTSLPTPASINNQSSVGFTSGAFSSVTFSNVVSTPVFQPIMTAVKTGPTLATIGDTMLYTTTISNSGNYPGFVTMTDILPTGTTLVPNSVLIGGVPLAGADPNSGMTVGIIPAGGSTVVTFSVVASTMPPSQQYNNQATAAFAFTLPNGVTNNGSTASNTVSTAVSNPNVTVVKSTASTDAVVGDTITYSFVITNSGIATVTNAILTDAIPPGSAFVPGSVLVGGVPQPAASPTAGIAIGTLAPGASTTASFNVTVTALPTPPTLTDQAAVSFTSGAFSNVSFSNTVVVPVFEPIIAVVKSANTANATVGDTIVYSLLVTNTGNLAANVTVIDPIPTGAVFVPNSIQINGVPQPGVDPATGVPIGTIPAGGTVSITLTLQVTVDSLPPSQQLANQATATYTYSPPDGRVLNGSVPSNNLVIPVSSPIVTVIKSTTAVDAVSGDTITYTINVTNNGIAPINNAVVVDPTPANTVFVPGSVTLDGTPLPAANPNTGIIIGTLATGVTAVITFAVTVQ